ncbi:hypothetical protein FACS189459_2260 [Bacilli bacterium]|nr:hypothetical protein FACS189459_2260 [Bacilli bacterium]
MQQNDKISSAILEIVKNDEHPIPAGIIISKLINSNVINQSQKTIAYQKIDELIHSRVLKQLIQSKKIVLNHSYSESKFDKNNAQTGTIAINNYGSGFITSDLDKTKKYFVNKNDTNNALSGDVVEFSPCGVVKETEDSLPHAIVGNVIKHNKDYYVGTIKINNDRLTIIPDDTKNLLIFNIEPHNGVVEGDKVLVRAGRYDKNIVYGFIDKIIGHKSDPGVEILSIVYDNGVNPEFDDALLENTRNITFGIDERNKKIRKNITHLPIITIDPATSKDFDDAVYVKKQGDKYLLSVSIADVSYYVKFKSKLDEEALKRGCSIYLVDRVIPMLPHNLSDDICSLNPNVERFTITCDILINNKGNFDKIDVYPSIIKSHRRFSYDEVNEYFSKKSSLPNDVQEIKDMLNDSFELHTILTDAKNKRGYIELNVPEPKIILDQNNIPIKIEKRTTGDAQKTIEDFMVAANEAVTIYAHKNNLPFIYRIHEKPSELKIENFKIEAKKLNFKITTDLENITSKDVRK